MYLTFVLALLLAAAYEAPPGPVALSWHTPVATAILALLPAAPGLLRGPLSWLLGRGSLRPRAFSRLIIVCRALPVITFGISVHLFDWPLWTWMTARLPGVAAAATPWSGKIPFLTDVAMLAPFLLAMAGSWYTVHALESLRSPPRWRLAAYTAYQARQGALVLLPWLTLSAGLDLATLAGSFLPESFRTSPAFSLGVTGVFLLAMFIAAPLAMRHILGTEPLPTGPLREALESFARRLNFRFRDILLWRTGGGVVNAAVAGLAGRFRYVFLTDGLLETLAPEEILAVFGHEIGHIAGRHFPLYILFGGGYVLFSLTLWRHLPTWLTASATLDTTTLALVLALWWGVFFRYLSRLLERQADVYGLLAADDPRLYIFTLEKVALFGGRGRSAPSFRHGSVADRVSFLARVIENPDQAARVTSRVRWITGALAAFATLCLAGIVFP